MNAITEYRVIAVSRAFSQKKAIRQLEQEVNEAIARGWEPIGGVAVGGNTYYQALVKRR